MLIANRSTLTGKLNHRQIDITEEQIRELSQPKDQRRLIQDIVPHLSTADREFLMTGITPEEWAHAFPEE